MKIQAMKQILNKEGINVDLQLSQLDDALSAIPAPIHDEIEEMIGEIVLTHEKNPIVAFSSVSSLLAGAAAVMAHIEVSC